MLFGDIGTRLGGTTPPDPDAVIDDFDSQDLSAYHTDVGDYEFATGVVRYGSGSALTSTAPDTAYHRIHSDSGLATYPTMADEFSVWVRTDDVSNAGVSELFWVGQDGQDDHYFARIDWDDDVELFAFEGGTNTDSSTSDAHGATDHIWYEFGVRWDDGSTFGGERGEMTAFVRDANGNVLADCSIVNDSFTGVGDGDFGVNYQAEQSGVTYYWDEAVILDQNEPVLTRVVDSFEDAGLTEYRGDTGSFSTTTSMRVDGSRSLYADGDSELAHIWSTSGLNNYPEAGDSFEVYVAVDNVGDPMTSEFFWAVQDHNETGYVVRFDWDTESVVLRREEDGDRVNLDSRDGLNVVEDSWYRLSIDWQADGTITAQVQNTDTGWSTLMAGADSTWDSGGIGFMKDSYGNEEHFFDYVNHPE